jgi:hypothetical protein
MQFVDAYIVEEIIAPNNKNKEEPTLKRDVTILNTDQLEQDSHIGCNQQINQLNQTILQYQQDLLSKQQEINQLSSRLQSTKENLGFTNKTVEMYPQVCKVNNNKKWIITLCVSVVVLLFVSTYSVSFIDRWLDNNNVDLFSHEDKMNELLLLVLQFIFIVFVVRFILEFV